MPRCMIALAAALLLLGAAAGAQDLRLDYVEGGLEIRQDGGWRELRIGSSVPAGATLKLAAASLAELSSGEGQLRLTLSQPGIYAVPALLQASREAARWGFGRLLGARLRAFFTASGSQSTEDLGTRAGDAEQEVTDWVEEESEAAREGNLLLAQGLYEEAVAELEKALELAEESRRADYLFRIGCAWSAAGRGARALQALRQARPSPWAGYYAEYLLLEARLLAEAQGCGEALTLLDELLAAAPKTPADAQPAWFLSAFCSLQAGDRARAREKLRKVVDLAPDTDFAHRAKEMLSSL